MNGCENKILSDKWREIKNKPGCKYCNELELMPRLVGTHSPGCSKLYPPLSNKINNIQICETESARKTLDMIMNGSFKSIVAPSAEGETNNYINKKQRFKLQKEFIFLMYIFYESENAWTIKINGDIYDSKNKNEITINNVAKIVTIGKNDIWFLLLDSSEEKVSQLQNLQLNKKTPYKSSYKIININKQSRILFRLFPGQIINTRTMLIEEF